MPATRPRWLDIAYGELGVTEAAGAAAHPRIMEYFRTLGADWVEDDATAWCGAFTGWCLETAGQKSPGWHGLKARAWLNWGIASPGPTLGCVVVLSRGSNPDHGHVGFYLGRTGDRIQVLSGNQRNAVSVMSFPIGDVLGYRWPAGLMTKALLPDAGVPARVARAAETARGSGTWFGGLMALLGGMVQFFEDGVAFLGDVASAVVPMAPAKGVLTTLGLSVEAVGFGLTVGGILIVLRRRHQPRHDEGGVAT